MSATQTILAAKQAERDQSVDFVDRTLEAVATENRDLSDAERSQLAHHKEILEHLDVDIRSLNDFLQVAASVQAVDTRIRTSPRPVAPQTFGHAGEFRSFGDLYVDDAGFNARGLLSHRVESEDVDVVQVAMQTRALLNEGATPGSLLVPSPDKFSASTPTFTTPLLDAITKIPVTSNSVDLLTYGEFTGSDVVAEGAQKPETVPVVGSTPTPLETIAGWVKYTRQLAEDAPGFAAWLNAGITRDILRKLQGRVSAAISAATLPTTTGAAGQPLIELVRVGMAEVEARGYTPNVLLGAPTALAGLDIAVLNLGGAASTVLGSGLWNLQPIPVAGMTDIIVADAADAFVLFTKRGVAMYTTDSDVTDGTPAKSDFRANILTTLGETRARGAVQNPNAAQEIVVTP